MSAAVVVLRGVLVCVPVAALGTVTWVGVPCQSLLRDVPQLEPFNLQQNQKNDGTLSDNNSSADYQNEDNPTVSHNFALSLSLSLLDSYLSFRRGFAKLSW